MGAVLLGDDDGALSVHGCGGNAGLSGESVLFSDAARPWTVMERTLPALATSWTSQRLANLGARVGPTRAAQYLAGALR